jgi:predicted aspartyl protease
MVISKDVDVSPIEETPQAYDHTPPSNPPEVEPLILENALIGFSYLQTLKLIGYIKHRKVIILVDTGSTHKFIHPHIAQEINFCICAVKKI